MEGAADADFCLNFSVPARCEQSWYYINYSQKVEMHLKVLLKALASDNQWPSDRPQK